MFDSELHLGGMDRQKFKSVRGLRVLVRVSIKRLNITFRLCRKENEEVSS